MDNQPTIFKEIIKFIVDNNIGDIASVAGIFITLIGFFITIVTIRRAKKITQQVRDDVAKINTVEEISKALMAMGEIRTLIREKTWSILPDRCLFIRKSLITIKKTIPKLSDNDKKSLQSAIQHYNDIEKKIEKAILNNESPKDLLRICQIISGQIDKLTEMLIDIKNKIGG